MRCASGVQAVCSEFAALLPCGRYYLGGIHDFPDLGGTLEVHNPRGGRRVIPAIVRETQTNTQRRAHLDVFHVYCNVAYNLILMCPGNKSSSSRIELGNLGRKNVFGTSI
jgi:hypothetical protein